MKNDYDIIARCAGLTLTQGQITFVDETDLPLIAPYRWCAVFIYNKFYVATNRAGKRLYMHRLIMGEPEGIEVDHRSGCGLDNHRDNLRIATHAENQKNVGLNRANTSGVKGVYWDRTRRKWHAQISIGNKVKFLGRFGTLEAGQEAYATASAVFHGDFGRTS